jgi:hypothetical protein
VTGIAPERTDLAVARILAGGLAVARVRIDRDARIRGLTFAGFEACTFVPFVGEAVAAYDESGEYPATVVGIDEAARLLYLELGDRA